MRKIEKKPAMQPLIDEANVEKALAGTWHRRSLRQRHDFTYLGAVSVSWNYHLLKMPNQIERQFPWLLQAHDNTTEASHVLFNPIEKKFYLLELSEAQGKLFKRSSHGWVATAEDKILIALLIELYLMNPLTRIQIKLPSRNRFPDVRKYRAKKVDK
ncbi:hypothetical protein LguiB_033019 [Lonicera macranthoides]